MAVKQSKAKVKKAKKPERLVVYKARFQVRVSRIDAALAKVYRIIQKYKGYIEEKTMDEQKGIAALTLRLPTRYFVSAWKDIYSIGTVVHQNITASDVTDRILNLDRRIANLRKAIDRFYRLLRKYKLKRRIEILQEIERLESELLDLEKETAGLRQRAQFSTIRLYIKAMVGLRLATAVYSPIRWIRRLSPAKRSIYGSCRISTATPAGFFDNEKEYFSRSGGPYLYVSVDQVRVRVGRVENDPVGTTRYYATAVAREAKWREYTLIEKQQKIGKAGISYFIYRITGFPEDSYYLIGISVEGGDVFIYEAYFPDKYVYDKRIDAVLRSLKRSVMRYTLWGSIFLGGLCSVF